MLYILVVAAAASCTYVAAAANIVTVIYNVTISYITIKLQGLFKTKEFNYA